MSAYTGLGGYPMVTMNTAAQFYFGYYYFFAKKR